MVYDSTLASSFPVTGVGSPVGTTAVWVLPITMAEEEPFPIIRLDRGGAKQIPRLPFANIKFPNNLHLRMTPFDLQLQVVADELLVGGPESESHW